MKDTLTVKKAKKFCEETLMKLENKENARFILLHSKLDSEIALILAEKKNVNKETLEIASWVHDIGKTIDKVDHEKHSIEILEKQFELSETLRDCILNHRTYGKPITEEGKLFRIADKISILHPEIVRNLVNCPEERYKKVVSFIIKTSAKISGVLEGFER
jgi:HD superfamily phosphodiesterase